MKYLKIVKNNFMKIYFSSIFLYLFSINFINAETSSPTPVIQNLKSKTFQQIIADFILIASDYVLTLLTALAVLVFLYGLMKNMFKGQGSDTARSEGRKLMLWGVIGLFVMTSVWGLVTIIASFVGHTDIIIPQF